MARQKQDNPPKRKWWPLIIALTLAFTTKVARKFAVSSLPQSQEHVGDARIQAVKQRELDRALEVHQPSSRTGICSLVLGRTEGALPEPYKITSIQCACF